MLCRFEFFYGEGRGNDAAHFPAVGYQACGLRLEEKVAYGRGLHGAGNHRQPYGIGRPLVQEVVGAAAADDVELFYFEGSEALQYAQDLLVPFGKGMEDAAYHLSVGQCVILSGAKDLIRCCPHVFCRNAWIFCASRFCVFSFGW